MKNRREPILNHPALIPVAGNFDRKPRSLDREVTTIGRARGTDLCLEANEISTLHCIIYRTAEGYRIRDCNSRTGTRINGASVKNQALHDADIINLGPFSFEFRVPPSLFPRDGHKIDPAKIEHWKQSREKLAQRALKLRRRLHETDHGASAREAELEAKAHQLKEKIKAYDHRLRDMEEAEQELTAERDKLAQEHEAHRGHVQQMESKLAQRLAQAEAEVHQRWQEFQLRCQADEARLQKLATAQSGDPSLASEMDAQQVKLRDLEESLSRQHQQLQTERQEFLAMKDQWVTDQTQSSVSLEEQQAAIAQREAAVNAQKAELMRMMGTLKKMQEDLRKQAKGDVRSLHDDIERLQNENAQLQAQVAGQGAAGEIEAVLEENDKLRARVQDLEQQAPAMASPDLDDLRAELDLLREELLTKEAEIEKLHHQPAARGASAASEQLRAENDLLKRLLQEKERFVEEMAEKSQHRPKNENDLERYETELNGFRQQLEGDRAKLNKEVEMLRERNKELDDAVREMEMEMSKERAELGRERMRLERVRDEIKGDMERMQREIAVRDSMAPVQKLRDEIAAKQAAGAGKGEKALNDRLRGFRNQLSDNPS